MHLHNQTPHLSPLLHCDYDHAYESIYDSAYGTGFVFYDEEELITDDGCEVSNLPASDIMPSGFFQR